MEDCIDPDYMLCMVLGRNIAILCRLCVYCVYINGGRPGKMRLACTVHGRKMPK